MGLTLMTACTPASVSTIDPDEEVLFFPSFGNPVGDGGEWELHIHGLAFEHERRAAYLTDLVGRLGLETGQLDERGRTLLAKRMDSFLVDNERGERVIIRLGERTFALDESGPNGHFFGTIRLSAAEVKRLRGQNQPPADSLQFEAVLPADDPRHFVGEVALLDETGVLVISDIDDTIKISQVADKAALLRNTFLRPYEPVAGMPAVYQSWAARSAARFHYVSASPWQLYTPLAEFIASAGYPPGVFHLKPFRWKDETFFSLFASPESYKLPILTEALARCPHRRFVLVGDSGEKDPEVYAALARQHPSQVVKIFIRDLGEPDENAARYQRVFEGLPRTLWQVFREPAELPATVP